jgi:hypothetical protein
MRQKGVPSYYRKNIAVHAKKRITREKPLKDQAKEAADCRSRITTEIGTLILTVLQEQGAGNPELERIAGRVNEQARDFHNRLNFSEETVRKLTGKRKNGQQYARDTLKKAAENILPGGFYLPGLEQPKGRYQQALEYERRDAADITAKMYAIACSEILGYDRKQVDFVMQEVKGRYSTQKRE